MNVIAKDATVLALVLMGAISDFNFMDVPFWAYIFVFFIYIVLRVYGKDVKIKKID